LEEVAILLMAGANPTLINFVQQTARQEIPPNAKEMLELWNWFDSQAWFSIFFLPLFVRSFLLRAFFFLLLFDPLE
jgi:hypothetical protein